MKKKYRLLSILLIVGLVLAACCWLFASCSAQGNDARKIASEQDAEAYAKFLIENSFSGLDPQYELIVSYSEKTDLWTVWTYRETPLRRGQPGYADRGIPLRRTCQIDRSVEGLISRILPRKNRAFSVGGAFLLFAAASIDLRCYAEAAFFWK